MQIGHGKVGPCTGIVATTLSSERSVTSIPMASMMVPLVSRSLGSTFLLRSRAAEPRFTPAFPKHHPCADATFGIETKTLYGGKHHQALRPREPPSRLVHLPAPTQKTGKCRLSPVYQEPAP